MCLLSSQTSPNTNRNSSESETPAHNSAPKNTREEHRCPRKINQVQDFSKTSSMNWPRNINLTLSERESCCSVLGFIFISFSSKVRFESMVKNNLTTVTEFILMGFSDYPQLEILLFLVVLVLLCAKVP